MEIKWKKIGEADENQIESWLNPLDRKFLCMSEKTWGKTASEISDCLKLMRNGQFRNVIGFVDGKAAVALMFGVEESGNVLNIYNIVVNPNFRGSGVGKQALKDVFLNRFSLNKTYSTVKTSVFKENASAQKLFMSCGFKITDENRDFLVFGKSAMNLKTLPESEIGY